jgi:hypothetical protein
MAIKNNKNKICKIVAWGYIHETGGGVYARELKAALTVE